MQDIISRISAFFANHFLSAQFRTIHFTLERKIGRKGPTLRDTECPEFRRGIFIFDVKYFFFGSKSGWLERQFSWWVLKGLKGW